MNADKMSIEDLLSDESFINYCKGISPDDITFWENYVKVNPTRSLLVNHAKEKYIQLFNALALADLEEQATRLKNSISEGEVAPVIQMEQFEKVKQRRMLPLLFKISAAAILIAGLFFASRYFVAGKNNDIKTYMAAYGERKNIQLPDGSIVTLNAGSNIKINEKFGTATRDVYLEGEAFFEVKHDTSHPFIVHTPAMDVKALGTAFNVKAYLNEKSTETSLIRGLVEVTLKEDNNLKMLLYPNQKIEWRHPNENTNSSLAKKVTAINVPDSLKKKLVVTHNGDIKEIAWKENKLIFDDEDFDGIAVLLERWYGAKINFKDSVIRNYRFTGIFEKEDLNTVLDYLKEARNFHYTIERGETLIINLSK
ncbi:FecR family protein [Ferruginibacter sp. SUN106]|uniref:FecR family protein n=1 Tax=Ferruginibacter sp. SUN106 TaxID=2978348 RepID=UPI003D36DEF3